MNKVLMRHFFQVFTAGILVFSMTIPVRAQQEDESATSAGAASDPTAKVNFQDIRFRYMDLGGGNLRRWYNTEGGYMLGCRNTAILTKFHSPSLWIKNNLKNTLEPIENKI